LPKDRTSAPAKELVEGLDNRALPVMGRRLGGACRRFMPALGQPFKRDLGGLPHVEARNLALQVGQSPLGEGLVCGPERLSDLLATALYEPVVYPRLFGAIQTLTHQLQRLTHIGGLFVGFHHAAKPRVTTLGYKSKYPPNGLLRKKVAGKQFKVVRARSSMVRAGDS
jgi:hypothetical protein